MRIFLLLILTISITTSCNDVNDLDGTWVFVSRIDEDGGIHNNEIYDITNNLLEFDNGQLKLFEPGWYFKTELRKNQVQVKWNKYIIDNSNDEHQFTFQSSNVLQFKRRNFLGEWSVENYMKINDSLKNKSKDITLVGKHYSSEFQTSNDTIHFIDESICTSNSWANTISDLDSTYISNKYPYHRFQENGFDIILTDMYPPFIIKEKKGNTLYISTLGETKEDYEMVQIENDSLK